MGKKGKGYRREEQEQPVKKKNIITQQQLMDKSHMDRTEFIPMLNTESLYEPFIFSDASEVAVKKIVTDLNYLLYTDFKTFWATVLYNPTLKNCLSTCLSFLQRRWMNNYRYSKETEEEFSSNEDSLINFRRVKDQSIYQYTEGLAQVLLVIYHRIVNFSKENKELSDLYKINEQITRKYIIDFPKLFQLAEIYGQTNQEIVTYVIKMYSKTVPTFYQTFTSSILPIIFKRMEDNLRRMKNLSQRQEYGINYSYKRLQGRQLSQGQEQFMKKTNLLMEIISFTNIINTVIDHFPEDCQDHCYFNSHIQFIFENVFLELQVAYKIWNYQGQEIKMLNMVNFILKQCIDYFIKFFHRCNDIIVLRNRKSSTFDAYLNSLQRLFKEFGKRNSVSKKNQIRNMMMYKIVQKKFNLLKMAQDMYAQETQEEQGNFNTEYLKDFIIVLENQLKDQYVNEDQPRQEEIQQETEAPMAEKQDSFDEEQDKVPEIPVKVQQKKEQKIDKQPQIQQLQILVPKRMRSQDYYTKLYANFNNKYYKGQYEDDYDDITDYDKRPLFFQQESSDTQSEEQRQRHLVSNANNLQHVKSLHNNHREPAKNSNLNKPKYQRVNPTNTGNTGKTQKPKYVAKQSHPSQEQAYLKEAVEQKQSRFNEEGAQNISKQQEQQRRGGQGYKKSNKSYNYKPKDRQDPADKHKNSNKNRDFEKQGGGGGKRYREK